MDCCAQDRGRGRRIAALFGVIALGLFLTTDPATVVAHNGTSHLDGTVTSIDGKQIVVTKENGRTEKFRVNAETTYQRLDSSSPVPATDLQVGCLVSVDLFGQPGGEQTALEIRLQPPAAVEPHAAGEASKSGSASVTAAGEKVIALDDPLARQFVGSYPAAATPTGVVREFDLTAAPSTVELIPGRPMAVWAYNGQVPGPILRVKLGETVRVRFENKLEQSTTVHWHGVRVPNAMDGVPGVTQDPVQPGGTFLYEFTPKDAGTFWFHPHIRSSEQVERGLFGILIVDDPDSTPFSKDVVWVLDDWLLNEDGSLNELFVTRHDLAHDGRWGNVLTVNGKRTPTFEARPGERWRLRMANVANGRVFDPQFSGLKPTIVAMDGMSSVAAFPASHLDLAPGNRVDFDLTFPADSSGRIFEVRDGYSRSSPLLARISVSGDGVTTPTGETARGKVPSWPEASAAEPTLVLHLNARAGGPYGLEWTINNQVMRHGDGTEPQSSHEHHAPYSLPLGRFAKIRFVNDSARLHPMHMHGVFFKVLARDGKPVNEPQWRDTVLLRGRQTIDVGVVPLDEGQWMLHCHILEHAESRMMTLVEVKSNAGDAPH